MRNAANLAAFCLSGCFSKPQQIVFATKATDAKFWPRQRPPLMGFPRKAHVSGVPGTQGPIPVRRNPQAQRKGWQHELSLTATSCGLLKQPDKQETTRTLKPISTRFPPSSRSGSPIP